MEQIMRLQAMKLTTKRLMEMEQIMRLQAMKLTIKLMLKTKILRMLSRS
jgi:hypothetical protein